MTQLFFPFSISKRVDRVYYSRFNRLKEEVPKSLIFHPIKINGSYHGLSTP